MTSRTGSRIRLRKSSQPTSPSRSKRWATIRWRHSKSCNFPAPPPRPGDPVQLTLTWRDYQEVRSTQIVTLPVNPAWAGKTLDVVVTTGPQLDELAGLPQRMLASQIRSFDDYLSALEDNRPDRRPLRGRDGEGRSLSRSIAAHRRLSCIVRAHRQSKPMSSDTSARTQWCRSGNSTCSRAASSRPTFTAR